MPKVAEDVARNPPNRLVKFARPVLREYSLERKTVLFGTAGRSSFASAEDHFERKNWNFGYSFPYGSVVLPDPDGAVDAEAISPDSQTNHFCWQTKKLAYLRCDRSRRTAPPY
jgi:hypothetical protein